jgi:sugar O-acyltransferase (sialic acid O-acetyltransferase NeuD family)
MRRLGIFGTSGHAREVADIAVELGYLPVYVARDQAERETWVFPDDVILEREISRHADIDFTIGIGEGSIRHKIAQRFANSLNFITLIHPSASFGQRQRQAIEECKGAIVCAGVRFTSNIRVGHFTLFNLNATISHDVIVEDFVTVSPSACVAGNVHLENGCWIGAGAVINQGSNTRKLIVGANTVVGSGSVVVKDCEPDAVYVGIPARRIK